MNGGCEMMSGDDSGLECMPYYRFCFTGRLKSRKAANVLESVMQVTGEAPMHASKAITKLIGQATAEVAGSGSRPTPASLTLSFVVFLFLALFAPRCILNSVIKDPNNLTTNSTLHLSHSSRPLLFPLFLHPPSSLTDLCFDDSVSYSLMLRGCAPHCIVPHLFSSRTCAPSAFCLRNPI